MTTVDLAELRDDLSESFADANAGYASDFTINYTYGSPWRNVPEIEFTISADPRQVQTLIAALKCQVAVVEGAKAYDKQLEYAKAVNKLEMMK